MSAPRAFATLSQVALPNAQTSILIVVDVAYVVGFGAGKISAGIYMVDNQHSNGSTDEGSLGLSTRCHLGDVISWEVMPIDPYRGDKLAITAIAGGTVFGSAGAPMSMPDTPNWYGQAMTSGSQSYEITIQLTTGALRPTVYTAYWEASISDVKPPK